jgi:hypothetical protein
MKTIGYLGQIDKLFGGRATTRNWNTIIAIVRILKGETQERPLITRCQDACAAWVLSRAKPNATSTLPELFFELRFAFV